MDEDKLDISWLSSIGGLNRRAVVHGTLRSGLNVAQRFGDRPVMTTDYGDLEVIRSFVEDFRSSWPWSRSWRPQRQAIERYSHEFQRPDGIQLSVDDIGGVQTALRSFGLGTDEVDLLVATDAEAILGIGLHRGRRHRPRSRHPGPTIRKQPGQRT